MESEVGKIGVFDSGFGGLTVLRALLAELPAYDYLFLADSARSPYGARSPEVINEFTLEAVEWLFEQGCSMVILACNTASARALRNLQILHLPNARPDRRILGVVRPSVEALAGLPPGAVPGLTKPSAAVGSVAVVATQSTIASDSYGMELRKLAPGVELTAQPCPLWAALVEAGELQGEGTQYFLRKDLEPIFNRPNPPQKLLLGCTHYPLLLPVLQKLVPAGVEILDQSRIVAERFADYLARHDNFETSLSRGGSREFYTTDDPEWFSARGARLLGIPFVAKKAKLLPAKMGHATSLWV